MANAAKAVRSISGDRRTATQTAIRYVLQHPAITSVVVGIRTMEQLEEAVKTIASPELSVEEMELLRKSVPALKYTVHR